MLELDPVDSVMSKARESRTSFGCESISKNLDKQMPFDLGPSLPTSRYDIRPTKKRYLILTLFALSSLSNAFQWIYLSSMTNVLVQYYQVSNVAINWTSMIYMVAYIPLILPATWIFEKIGLRWAVILGSMGTSSGAIIKMFSCSPDRFTLLMLGQTVSAISQLFILSVPPRLASLWFPDDQVSLANAIGVFGNQLGIALGFIVPRLFVDYNDYQFVESSLVKLFSLVALISAIITLSIVCLFEECPKYAPGLARFRQIIQENVQPLVIDSNSPSECEQLTKKNSFTLLMMEYARDRDFILLLISYGLNVGVFYGISTILNQMFTSANVNSSELGLLMVVSGMFGSVLSGYVLDKTHSYRLVNCSMYILSLISTIFFAFIVERPLSLVLVLTIASLGFFMTGYLVIGYEITNEITWPRPESVSAGLLNLSAQVFGVILTLTGSFVVDKYGPFWVNIYFSAYLIFGAIVTTIMRTELRRQNAIEAD